MFASPFDKAVKVDAYIRLAQAAVLVAIILLLLVPGAASADIYKWIDENGRTVYSNVKPTKVSSLKNVQVVVEDEKVADSAKASDAATQREQELLERIARLERQLQAQQYQAQPPPPSYYGGGGGGYPSDYYSAGYYPSMYYPAYYPTYLIVLPRRFVAPGRTFASPRFVPVRGSSFHRGGMGRGRR